MDNINESLQKYMKYIKHVIRIAQWTIVSFFLITFLMVLFLRWIDPPFSSYMVQCSISAWWNDKDHYKTDYQWVDWKNISRHGPLAVVASEDQKFPVHRGFDTESIAEAWLDRKKGTRFRGASTISQQVAKNLFLWPGKSFLRKGLEAWYTVLIELLWSKKRILEVYLNVAQFGDGVFGVKAAGKKFFRSGPSGLRRWQCALLAATLPNPLRLKADRPSRYVSKQTRRILREMNRLDRSVKGRYLDSL